MAEFEPKKALEFLESKGIKVSSNVIDMAPQEHASAFTVSGIAQKDILKDLKTSLERALREGETFESWSKDIKNTLDRAGWSAYGENITSPYRLKTIYDTNLRSARSAGQWDRIQRTKRTMPYLMYMLGPSRDHARPKGVDHSGWAGTILPADHPWWDTHYPPNAWGCKCWVRQITEKEAKRRGITQVPPKGGVHPSFRINPGQSRAAALQQALKESNE